MGMIYRHVSPSGRSYIGMTKNTWQQRASGNPLKGYAGCVAFHKAIEKYGWENFKHEILEDNIPNENLIKRETYWIQKFINTEHGVYNILKHGTQNINDIEKYKQIITKEELQKFYVDEGMSMVEAGNYFGVDFTVIRTLLSHYELPSHPPGHRGKSVRESDRRKREQTSKRNISYCEFCNTEFVKKRKTTRFCSKKCFQEWIRKERKGNYKMPTPNYMQNIAISERHRKIADDYISGMTTKEVCNKYGISRGTIRNALISCGYPTRIK